MHTLSLAKYVVNLAAVHQSFTRLNTRFFHFAQRYVAPKQVADKYFNLTPHHWYSNQYKCFVLPSRNQDILKFHRVLCRSFQLSQRRNVNPIVLFFFKLKGAKILKGFSIIFARTFRKLHGRLPENVQRQISKHKLLLSFFLIVSMIVAYYSYEHYDTCPITGRKRWISFTKDQVIILSDMDNKQLLQQYRTKFLDQEHPVYLACRNIVEALIKNNQDIDIVKTLDWKLNVVDDPDMHNAFVLPSGEIYIFTGMIKLMTAWEELAMVVGHEMAHAILGHVQEQQSFVVFGELLMIPVLAFIWFFFEDFIAFIAHSIQHYLYPLIFELGFNLPYSRELEMEADIVGTTLASKACFDPRWSVLLWDKMAFKGVVDLIDETIANEDVEFISSHPSHERRAVVLEENLPEALNIRMKCNCPELSNDFNPLIHAQLLRKCTINLRSQLKLKEEAKDIALMVASAKSPDSTLQESEIEDLQEALKAILVKIKSLDIEYNGYLDEMQSYSRPQKPYGDSSSAKKVSQNKSISKTVAASPSKLSMAWRLVVGGLGINAGTKSATSNAKETSATINVESFIIGKNTNSKRNYYDLDDSLIGR